MKSDNRNYIYAYNENEQQIVVIDAETGEQISPEDNRVCAILLHLKEKNQEVKLRKFALWCAFKANAHLKPIQKKFLELADRAIHHYAEQNELQQCYNDSEGQAIAIDTIGLRQGSAKAPGFLASRECINPNAFEGAKNAARFHCLWAQMSNDGYMPDFLEEIGPAVSESIIEQTEQKQVDYLLDLMGE